MSKYLYILLITAVFGCHKDPPIPTPIPFAPWEILKADNNLTFSRVLFVNEDTGFVLGNQLNPFQPNLFKTTDGGKTWKTQNLRPPTVSGFFDFFILNENIIYTNGFYDGPTIDDTMQIFKSTDGGNTWNVVQGNYHEHPGGLYFRDENYGITSTSGGLYKTTDGCKTWAAIPNPGNINFFGISHPVFTSRNGGYAAGGAFYDGINFGTTVRTTDGGDTWQDISANVSKNLAKVTSFFFVNDHTGFLFTVNYEVYKTTDGGNTWTLVNDKMSTEYPYFLNENEGYIAGYGNSSGIYHTTDGGKTWTAEYSTVSGDHVNGITFPSPNIGYAVTDKGLVLKKIIK